MKRSRWFIVSVFTGLSLVLLLIQVDLLRRVFKQAKEEQKWGVRPTDPELSILLTLRTFVGIASKHNIPLIPIEPSVLTSIATGSKLTKPCPILCTKVILFGTFSKFINHKPKVWETLVNVGFEVVTVESPNPRLLPHGYNVPIPTHYILLRWDCAIHVVVFYERESGYWWHSALTINETIRNTLQRYSLSEANFILPRHERAFEKFEVVSVKLWNLSVHLPKDIPAFTLKLGRSRFVECNHTRARLFRDKYKPDSNPEALEFKSDAWRLLSKAKQLLDSIGIPFWLSSGTCLGYFRQCDIITYSKDVDIGVWIEDFKPEMISLLSSHGIPLKHLFGRVNDSFELSFQDGEVKLDIFFFYRERDYAWNGGTQARTGRKFKYIFPLFSMCWTEFLELKVRVPCETEAYIEANYGQNWMIPVKTWDWKQSPPNVRENGAWPEEDWPLVIRLYQYPGL